MVASLSGSVVSSLFLLFLFALLIFLLLFVFLLLCLGLGCPVDLDEVVGRPVAILVVKLQQLHFLRDVSCEFFVLRARALPVRDTSDLVIKLEKLHLFVLEVDEKALVHVRHL